MRIYVGKGNEISPGAIDSFILTSGKLLLTSVFCFVPFNGWCSFVNICLSFGDIENLERLRRRIQLLWPTPIITS